MKLLSSYFFAGSLHKPTIWAEPGSVITSGSHVTIWCQGNLEKTIYVIYKEGSPDPWDHQNQIFYNNNARLVISSITELNAGIYHCYSYTSTGWTERSNTLELVVTGVYHGKPTLSALSSPVVTSGGNVTLKCVSSKGYDWFTLTGSDQNFSMSEKAQFIHTGQSLALFPEITMASSKSEYFRCYGYYTNTPHVWSEASDPLEIHYSEFFIHDVTCLLGLARYQKAVIGVSVAFFLLLFFLTLFLLLRLRHQNKDRKGGE
ncbi:Leukocyte immunoglobulin-like receptor subfamily A member 6 [Lemmus lemmus]